MPKPFDATLKDLIRNHPLDWLRQLNIPPVEPIEVLDADLSAVSAAADTLIRVGDRIIHIDVESGPDPSLAERMLLYNVLARYQTRLPVHTTAVLLRSNAQRATLTDRVEYAGLSFRFDLLKVWELTAEALLQAGVGLIPLAVLGRPPDGLTREQALSEQVARIADRIELEATRERNRLLAATYILSSMHVEATVAREVINRVLNLKETPGYRLAMLDGAVEQMHAMIEKQGKSLLGKPTEQQIAKLKSIDDLDRLDRLSLRVLKAKSWDALLRGR